MDEERFEEHRAHLRAVAYRMLGSLSEADDAVPETGVGFSRAGADGVENLGGWLTTIVSRVCLTMLRTRESRPEDPLDTRMPDPILSLDELDPEQEVLLADAIGLALLVVVQTLAPAERLAFVLHDMFAVPFEEIAPIVDRSPAAARKLASRARRRVQGSAPVQDPDPARRRAVVDAFLAASRAGDFDALVAVLDPDVVLHADFGGGRFRKVRGAEAVASQAQAFSRLGLVIHPALVNGAVGAVAIRDDERPFSVGAFTVRDGKIVELDFLVDPERLAQLDLTVLDG